MKHKPRLELTSKIIQESYFNDLDKNKYGVQTAKG